MQLIDDEFIKITTTITLKHELSSWLYIAYFFLDFKLQCRVFWSASFVDNPEIYKSFCSHVTKELNLYELETAEMYKIVKQFDRTVMM